MLPQALQADRITVNSMCPAWVRTAMGGPNASRSVAEGADTATWLADEAPHELTGKFFRDRQEIPWKAGCLFSLYEARWCGTGSGKESSAG